MVLDLEEGITIESLSANEVRGRRSISIAWAKTKVRLTQWTFQMHSREGRLPDECFGAFPKQMRRAWKLARRFKAGLIEKRDLVLMSACPDRFHGQVSAIDGSTPFDRYALLPIDIDLSTRNEALTIMEMIRERLPEDQKYPLAISPGGKGIKMFVPAAIGKGVPWHKDSRALFCRLVFESLVGSLAAVVKIDTSWAATCRTFLAEDVLHELLGDREREVIPVIIQASGYLESLFGEKRPAGEFPDITTWALPQISQESFQTVVDHLIASVRGGRRLTKKDSIAKLGHELGTFLEDNNPVILNDGEDESLFNEAHLREITGVRKAAIQKRGAILFLGQLEKLTALLRFVISMRRWGTDAPRSVTFISHGLEQCRVKIHHSQVDTLLKELVKAGLLIRTREPQRGRSPAWYKLVGPAEADYNRKPNSKPTLEQPLDGHWHQTLMEQIKYFESGDSWLEHLNSFSRLHAKPERLRDGIGLWNNWARKKNLQPIGHRKVTAQSS